MADVLLTLLWTMLLTQIVGTGYLLVRLRQLQQRVDGYAQALTTFRPATAVLDPDQAHALLLTIEQAVARAAKPTHGPNGPIR